MASREPSMEAILAPDKKELAAETGAEAEGLPEDGEAGDDDVLELDEPLAPPVDLGPPLLDEDAAGHSREALEELQTIPATIPAAPAVNPLEDMVREMLRP